MIRGLFFMMWLVLAGGALLAQPDSPHCVVCRELPEGPRVWKHPKGLVCEACKQLEEQCSVCGLPIRQPGAQTGDGRLICRGDAPRAVLKEPEAQRLFYQTQRGLVQLSRNALALKNPRVKVNLFDVDYWNHQNGQALAPKDRRIGMAQTRRVGDGYAHVVLLLSGRLEDEVIGACAHEYMHLWINENKPEDRKIERDTLEAICELVAYKYMEALRKPAQMEKIRANPYTNGEIETLIAFEKRYGLATTLKWVVRGKESKLDPPSRFNPPTFSDAAPSRSGAPRWGNRRAAASKPKPAPKQLSLKGISGAAGNRMALINRQIFQEGDVQKIALSGRETTVECVEIRRDSVLVKVDGAEEPMVLKFKR